MKMKLSELFMGIASALQLADLVYRYCKKPPEDLASTVAAEKIAVIEERIRKMIEAGGPSPEDTGK